MKLIYPILFFILFVKSPGFSQFPWNNPLKIATSTDGINFNTPTIFQDSSGVPSVIKWKGDTLVAVFQWFRAPNPSVTWDRVAVKFSYDNGITWTQPVPVVVNGLPVQYQRPFDPTLAVINNDSLRIYFSSSDGIPPMGLDSTINTYSATSTDGMNFTFEPDPRVDQLTNKVIDPAVIFFNNSWHYIAPIGAPQQGAYHYISPDGINFSQVQNIPSDINHNWTGNYMVENINELRFYGCGQNIWFNTTPNGGVWNGYVNTNLQGGDPTVVKTGNANYLIIYVGQPYSTGIADDFYVSSSIAIYPNPSNEKFTVKVAENLIGFNYYITDNSGKQLLCGNFNNKIINIDLSDFPCGNYYLVSKNNKRIVHKMIKVR